MVKFFTISGFHFLTSQMGRQYLPDRVTMKMRFTNLCENSSNGDDDGRASETGRVSRSAFAT